MSYTSIPGWRGGGRGQSATSSVLPGPPADMYLLEKVISIFTAQTNGTEPNPAQEAKDVEEEKESDGRYERRTTYVDGLAHMFRATVGTGVLGLPVAFSQSGYLVGVVGVLFVTYLSLYCAVILASCQLKLGKKDKSVVPTFQGSVAAAFNQGPKRFQNLAPFFVASTNVVILVGQIGGVCVYFIFIASNIQAAVGGLVDLDLRQWTALVGVPILAINMVVSLKRLVLVSGLGNSVLLASLAIILYYVLREPLSLEGRRPAGEFRDLPQFFGTVFFASGYINMVLPLQSEMAEPELVSRRCGVLDMNSVITGTLYTVFGFLGYLRYGDQAKGSITLNLPGETIGTTVQVLLALSVMTATALQNYISVSIIWDDYLDKKITKNRLLMQYLLRAGIVIITLCISVSIPNLELLVSVTGILGQCVINTALPCIVHVLTCYEQDSLWAYAREFWMDAVAVAFSVFILVTSAGTMYLEIRESFK